LPGGRLSAAFGRKAAGYPRLAPGLKCWPEDCVRPGRHDRVTERSLFSSPGPKSLSFSLTMSRRTDSTLVTWHRRVRHRAFWPCTCAGPRVGCAGQRRPNTRGSRPIQCSIEGTLAATGNLRSLLDAQVDIAFGDQHNEVDISCVRLAPKNLSACCPITSLKLWYTTFRTALSTSPRPLSSSHTAPTMGGIALISLLTALGRASERASQVRKPK